MVHASVSFSIWQAISLALLAILVLQLVLYRRKGTAYLVTEGLELKIKKGGRYSGVRVCFNSECYGSEKLVCAGGACMPEVSRLEATPSIEKIHMSLPGAQFEGEAILSAHMFRVEGMLYRSGKLYILFPHPDNPRRIVRRVVYGPGRVEMTMGLGVRAGQAHIFGCSNYSIVLVLETAREKDVRTLDLTCTKTGEIGKYAVKVH